MVLPAIGELRRQFDADASGVAWVLTGYLLTAAIFTPVFGRLGDMFGRRKMLVLSLLLFAAGSTVAALANSLELVVAGRLIQGASGGIFPLSFGIIRDEFPPALVPRSIGLISATVGVGGGLGLIVGGLLLDHLSYHWVFWLGTVLGLAAAAGAQLFVPESPERRPGKVDIPGAAVFGLGVALPLAAIARANSWGWGSPRVLGLFVAGALILVGWVVLERRTREPMADMRLLAAPPILVTNIATVLVGFGMFTSFVLVPQLAEDRFHSSPTTIGLLMLPGALSMLLSGPASGMLGARLGNKVPLALGGLITAAGLVGLALDHPTELSVLGWNLLASVGVGLAFAAMPNLIVEAAPRSKTGEATGFNTVMRSVGSSLGAQVSGAILVAHTGNDGFVIAFLLGAGVATLAAAGASLIPRVGHEHLSLSAEIGAAAPLPDPAVGGDR
jgi:EmrB/QacA subfamily drug resistance transporter